MHDQFNYSRPTAYRQLLAQQHDAHGSQYPTPSVASRALPSPFTTNTANGLALHDRPVLSIERDDAPQPTAPTPVSAYDRDRRQSVYAHRPVTPEPSRSDKRRRVECSPGHMRPGLVGGPYRPAHYQSDTDSIVAPMRPIVGEIVDLTTPERPVRSARPSPLRAAHAAPSVYDDQSTPAHAGRNHDETPLQGQTYMHATTGLRPLPASEHYLPQVDPEPYDPTQPLMQVSQDERVQGVRPVRREFDPAPLAAYPVVERRYYQPTPYEGSYPSQNRQPLIMAAPYQQVMYQPPAPATRFVQVPTPIPQPVHGAPAPVQQVPRAVPNAGSPNGFAPHGYQVPVYGSLYPAAAPTPAPTNGAPHPAQLYQPR